MTVLVEPLTHRAVIVVIHKHTELDQVLFLCVRPFSISIKNVKIQFKRFGSKSITIFEIYIFTRRESEPEYQEKNKSDSQPEIRYHISD